MSLDKAIQHGKEKRKQYRGAKAFDPACRNHGDDDWSKTTEPFKANGLNNKQKQKLKRLETNIKRSKL
jgi:hypothetical protein